MDPEHDESGEDTPEPRTERTDEAEARAGRVAIFGRPNVGKSTFLNRVLGQKLVIATARPGTTRSAVLGVYLKEDPPTQIAFVDSPGVARPRTPLHKVLVEQAQQALSGADVVLWMTEVPSPKRRKGGKSSLRTDVHPTDLEIVRFLEEVKAPVVVAVNKVDRVQDKRLLLPILEKHREVLTEAGVEVAAMVPISARKGTQVDALIDVLREHLPEGLLYEDPDFVTDRPQRFFVAELIREAVIRATKAEVPYGAAVFVERFDATGRVVKIHATVVVEKPSHKGIVIGAQGARIKQIGIEARQAIEEFLEQRAHLELWVKVVPGWTNDPQRVKRFATEADG